MTAVSRDELEKLRSWAEQGSNVPSDISIILKQVLSVYLAMTQGAARAKETLKTLRRAMGFLPKSERGSTTSGPEQLPMSAADQSTVADLEQKRLKLVEQKSVYDTELKKIRGKSSEPSGQLEFNLADSFEMVFSFPTGSREEIKAPKQRVDRMDHFAKTKGMHSTFDTTKRVDLQIVVKDIEYQVETVTDPETGKSVRASMANVGPANFQMTWNAIANLMKLHVGFAIPINRLSMLIGQPEFSASQIYRVLKFLAESFLPIYLQLADDLSEVKNILGDDTPTKVLDLADQAESIANQIDERLGWSSPRADGKGPKKAVNVSLLMGKTEADPRSMIRFFRTHMGGLGNLLSKILESRTPKAGSLTFQGDLSSVNLPTQLFREKFQIRIAGCGAHARRPFHRYREDDAELCYYLLRAFLKLSHLETRIDEKGRTTANVLRYRSRYGKMIWAAIHNRCQAAVTGQITNRNCVRVTGKANVWPPSSDLHTACMYIINHYESLTLYLTDPILKATNNGSERGLRVEKCMLSSSKFRRTRTGRAVLDILRTLNATCTAAELDPAIYFREVAPHLHDLQNNPERYTPFAIAKKINPRPQT